MHLKKCSSTCTLLTNLTVCFKSDNMCTCGVAAELILEPYPLCLWLNLRVSESCSAFSWSTVLFRCSQISTTWLACLWLDSTLSCSSASISSLLLLASVARKELAPSPCWPTLYQQERWATGFNLWNYIQACCRLCQQDLHLCPWISPGWNRHQVLEYQVLGFVRPLGTCQIHCLLGHNVWWWV